MSLTSEQSRIIAQLYEEMYLRLCIYAINSLGNKALSEEAVQDVFRIACMKPESLIQSENPKGWLTITLKYVIYNIKRSQAKLSNLVVDALSIENMEFASSQNDEADFNFIYSDMLGQDDFELLKMITLDGYTMLDASRKYKISVEACKKRVQRARAKFKKLVKDIS